jgi:hypothetical protein
MLVQRCDASRSFFARTPDDRVQLLGPHESFPLTIRHVLPLLQSSVASRFTA